MQPLQTTPCRGTRIIPIHKFAKEVVRRARHWLYRARDRGPFLKDLRFLVFLLVFHPHYPKPFRNCDKINKNLTQNPITQNGYRKQHTHGGKHASSKLFQAKYAGTTVIITENKKPKHVIL